MTAEFHRKIIEIQRAVRQRELHRLELERELTLSAQRKEKSYEKLYSQLHALKTELLREELTTKRRIEGLFTRVEVLEKEYDATIKKTSQLRAKQKHIELRRSLSRVLHNSYYDYQAPVSTVTQSHHDVVGVKSVDSKSTQTDLDANFFHDAHNYERYTAATHLVIQPQNPFYYAGSHHQLLPSSVYQCYPRTDSTYDLSTEKPNQTSVRHNNRRDVNASSSYNTNTNESNISAPSSVSNPSRYEHDADQLQYNRPMESHNSNIMAANSRNLSGRKYSDPEISSLMKEEDSVTELYTSGLLKQRRMSTPALHSSREQSYPIASILEMDSHRIPERTTDESLKFNAKNVKEIIPPRSSTNNAAPTLATNVDVPSKGALKSGNGKPAVQTPTTAKPFKLVSFVSPKREGNVTKESCDTNANESSKGNGSKSEVASKTDEVPPPILDAKSDTELKSTKRIVPKDVVLENDKITEDSSDSEYSGIEDEGSVGARKMNSESVKSHDDDDDPSKSLDRSSVTTKKEEPKGKLHADTPTSVTKILKDLPVETGYPKDQQAISIPQVKAEQYKGKPNVNESSAEAEKLDKQPTENKSTPSAGKVSAVNVPLVKTENSKYQSTVNSSSVVAEQKNYLKNENINKNSDERQSVNQPTTVYSNIRKTDQVQTNIMKKKVLDDDFFDDEVPLKESTAYQRMLGIHSASVPPPKPSDTAEERNERSTSDYSPSPMVRASQRWGAKAEGSGVGGARPSDTDSVDSVEAAIQASISVQKVRPPEKENMDGIDNYAPATPKLSPENPKPKEVLNNSREDNKIPAKAPVNIKLDSESESYSMSAGGVSEEDDFDFST